MQVVVFFCMKSRRLYSFSTETCCEHTKNIKFSKKYDSDHFFWKILHSVSTLLFLKVAFCDNESAKRLIFKAEDVIFFFVYSGGWTGMRTDFSRPLWWHRILQSSADPPLKNAWGSRRGARNARDMVHPGYLHLLYLLSPGINSFVYLRELLLSPSSGYVRQVTTTS